MKTNLRRRKLFLESLEERELLAVTAGWTEPAAHLAAPMTTGDLIPTPGIDVMNLNSNPGATYTIYLDFDGHVITDPNWHPEYTGGADVVIPRFNLDGNAEKESFSLEEEAAIYRIWQIVSEDFMPFDVNVTTVEPSSDAFLNCLAQRAVFGGGWELVGQPCTGISKFDAFFISGDLPCLVFTDTILNGYATDTCRCIAKMGNTASHELGHTFYLTHKGKGGPADYEYNYYYGRNDWGPIMGAADCMELMQWSKGEYDGAHNMGGEIIGIPVECLDELQVISSKIGYRVDDYADSFDGAAVLSISGGAGEIAGIIERNTDVDCFVFESDGSDLHFTIGGIQGVTNLDTLVKVYSEDRELIAVYDPTDRLDVEFVFSQQAGTYYITVDGTGLDTGKTGIYSDYGSLGAYTVRVLGRDYTPPVTETYIVTTLDDVVADDGLLSLREAVSLADDDAVILFAPSLVGGTIHLTEGEILINRAVTIDASSVGGITIDADGKSRIFRVLFGGGLSSSPVKLIDLTITGGKSGYGAGIYCCYGVTTLTNCTISGNVASGEGGGIYNTGTVTLIDCTVSGNTADSGGGMYGLCAKTTAIDCTISNNIAIRGGGIESSIGTLVLTGCSVSGNRAKNCDGDEDGGGGIFIYGGQLTATDCFITENTSDNFGGGIFNNSGVVKDSHFTTRGTATLTRCTISGNTAAERGGGIFTGSGHSDNYGWMTLTDCIISKNTSGGSGGGLYNYRGTLTAVGCTISDNTAETDGGGFSNNMEAKAILLNTVISGNTAVSGGGICNSSSGTLTLRNITVSVNTVKYDGGGIFNSGTLTATNCAVTGNTSKNGGGVYGYYSTLELTDCVISKNTADDSPENNYGTGGGIVIVASVLTATDCTITENSTNGAGGGIDANSDNGGADVSDVTLIRCEITGNRALAGGGVYNNYGTITLVDSTVSGNTAFYNNTGGSGGGIYNRGSMTLTNTIVSGNTAEKSSGGIVNYQGTLTAVGCTISDNTAKTNGGGFINSREGKAILSNTVISGNTAETSGGGIYNTSTSLELTIINSTISGNVAIGDVGGICVGAAAVNLTNTIVALNYSPAGTEIDGEYSGGRNIVGSDPGFVAAPVFEDGVLINADALDLLLTAGSAAIDAGTNEVVETETDVAGNPRIVNGIVDLGAYEYQGAIPSEQLATPTILTGNRGVYVSAGANRHQIIWEAIENASGYELTYTSDNRDGWTSVIMTETSAVITGLTYGDEVAYRVRALGEGSYADSEWSERKTFAVCPMDIDGDGDIGGADRGILAYCWLAEEGDNDYIPAADIDGNGDVGGSDRAYLANNWLNEVGVDDMIYPRPLASEMVLEIDGQPMSVLWEENESVAALRDLVSKEPLNIQMSMYGGFEQVGSIGARLPRNDVQTTTTAGDIVLYSGNQIVVFYGSNSWSYTRLGRISDRTADELTEILGSGDVSMTLTMT